MYGGDHEVPVIARTQISRGRGYGPQHCCDPAGTVRLLPGLARGLADHTRRLRGLLERGHAQPRSGAGHRRPPPGQDDRRPAGRPASTTSPRSARRGSRARARDVTVVTWGYAAAAGDRGRRGLAERGIEVEIIDPRWLDRASFDRGRCARVGRPHRCARHRRGRPAHAVDGRHDPRLPLPGPARAAAHGAAAGHRAGRLLPGEQAAGDVRAHPGRRHRGGHRGRRSQEEAP